MLKTLQNLYSKGATNVNLHQTKVKFGFTLAEILITLGIIGVVATITIPNLINNYKAKQLRTQFFKSYSVISQAIKLMQSDDISADPRDYTSDNYHKTFAKYINAPTICTGYIAENNRLAPAGCYIYKIHTQDEDYTGKQYSYLRANGKVFDGLFNNGQIMLTDGTLIFFDDGPIVEGWKGVMIMVDINGSTKGPNKLGYDFFAFEILDGTLHTIGDPETSYKYTEKCDLDNVALQGWQCATQAKSDAEYFKKVVKKVK